MAPSSSERTESESEERKEEKMEKGGAAGTAGAAGSPERKPLQSRHLIPCRYGRACTRVECWFKHPEGRQVDRRKGKGKGKGKGKPCHFRRSSRSSSRSQRWRSPVRSKKRTPSRSPSKPRKARRASRKASRKARKAARRARSSTSVKSSEKEEKKTKMKEMKETRTEKMTEKSSKLSFRDFIMHHFKGDSADDAMAAFKAYCEKIVEKDFELMRETALIWDLYHPLRQLRLFDWHRSLAQERAKNFAEDWKHGKYTSLSLRARRTDSAMTCRVSGHLQAPEFAFDSNVGSLMVTGLPPSVSVWDVVEAFQDHKGFITAAWKPGEKLKRTFYARFATEQEAQDALLALPDDLLNTDSSSTARASLQEASPELSALVLPPEMSSTKRLQKDLQLSAAVIQRLDELQGVLSNVLAVEGPTEFKVDLQVIYLRRVHHFCFYAGKWCQDEWSLREACGAATVRERAEDDVEGPWSKAHDERIQSFLDSLEPASRPSIPQDDVKIGLRFKELSGEKMVALGEQKWRCQECSKLFKGEDYVYKHLFRVHTDIMEDIKEEFYQSAARAAFCADQQRPEM